MTLHPAAPEDLPALTAAYAHTVQAISDLGHSLRPGDEERRDRLPRLDRARPVRARREPRGLGAGRGGRPTST